MKGTSPTRNLSTHNRQELRETTGMYISHVGVKIVGRPDLADWKTKICLIIVLKQVEEKVSIFHTHVGVKIVGRPDLADWKTKICLIIVEEKVTYWHNTKLSCYSRSILIRSRGNPWHHRLSYFELRDLMRDLMPHCSWELPYLQDGIVMRSHFVSWLVSELGSVLKSPFSLLLLTYSIRNRIRAIGNSARRYR